MQHNKVKKVKIKNLSTWTTNCKILIKLNGSSKKAKVLVIENILGLEKKNISE